MKRDGAAVYFAFCVLMLLAEHQKGYLGCKKTSALNIIEMVVNASAWGTARSTTFLRRFLTCQVGLLKIWITGD